MVIFWVLTVCGGVIRQYGNVYQNYNNFSKIVFSVYRSFITVVLLLKITAFCLCFEIYDSCFYDDYNLILSTILYTKISKFYLT